MPSIVSTDGIVTVRTLLKALNGYSMLVSGAGITWARLGSDIVYPAMFVFN